MSKDTVLLIGIDLGKEKDCQCATLNLYYNETNHIIYQTTDKEQVLALNEIMEEVNKEKTALQKLEQIDNAKASEALECLERIDNTLCLNNIKGKLEFGIDTEEHTDCDSVIGMTEDLETIKQYILKVQENENARAFGKDIINLNKTLKQTIDKPIFYASRYGNKYIVPQELLDKHCNILTIINEKGLPLPEKDIISQSKDYNEYCAKWSWLGKTTNISIQKNQEEFELLKQYFEKNIQK